MGKMKDLFGEEIDYSVKVNKLEDYDGFVEKFKPKKTTDDCYTPQCVYDEVVRFVRETADIDGKEIVRPFWPGGDYEHFPYPENCVVIDNPPFSIITKIIRFYVGRDIPFFVFAPHLTLFKSAPVTYIVTAAHITYENGAIVSSSFISNLYGNLRIWVCGKLRKRLENIQKRDKPSLPKYVFPPTVCTSATLGRLSVSDIDFKVNQEECLYVGSKLRSSNIPLFGGAFLLSERKAAEREAAEREAAERKAAERKAEREVIEFTLSPSEIEIVKSLK